MGEEIKKLREALGKIEDVLTDYLLANTDVDHGFEAIPEIDEARTIAQEALGHG
jgi:hypothetical protein